MPKRSAQEKLERYKRKIRRLERKENEHKHWRRIQQQFDSSEDENIADTNDADPRGEQEGAPAPQVTPDVVDAETALSTETMQESALDPELLSALGSSTSDAPDFGDEVHGSLATLWTPLLKKGLPKEDKDKLMKEHLIPSNCMLLQAPKLNVEISAAVSELVRGRDKKLVCFQQQLGNGTAAINKAMDTLLKSDNKVLALRYLSDGCRLLSDLHYCLTKDRIKLITPSLEKNFLHVIQDTERDETLYGNLLSEKIKASKAIEKQGSQIRKPTSKPNSGQPVVASPAHQGNWSGPPRYPANRGGRGGQRRPPPLAPRRPYPTQTQTQAKSSYASKTRASQQK
ncbi:uncharacterized protein LOC113496154 isoform X2 [Trichoplusia ni]|uniref:Uncharacterized protein LOC113496154 isoform X2 n=1 Tax=Trichoplusia ni TaxID=7111 RepID=A0A7E5VRU6_TRINI|nr:uncharacterized protein LOC113496154 isoform X2 [Trichoplusia ni]XP_026731088.1 uncharacterized protein LOC113496154 isoform X2 [Trichoplusia ni]